MRIHSLTLRRGSPLTRTALAANPNISVQGTAVTLTATVTIPPPGSGAPTGSVSFLDGFTLLGTSAVSPSRIATVSLPCRH
jgi:hypothetical protein